jgi:taurine dioxygenase
VCHPLVVRHPRTGERALYGVSGTATGIDGMIDRDAIELLRSLKLHALRADFRQSVRAAAATILVWDNLAVMHSATPTVYSDADGERRLLHRISIRADAPLRSAAS